MPAPYLTGGVQRIETARGIGLGNDSVTRLVLSSGVMEAQTLSRKDGPDEFVPVSFTDLEKTGLITFSSGRPLIQLQMTEGYVTLSAHGIGFGEPHLIGEAPLHPWDEEQAGRFVLQLLDDQQLQTSFLSLHRNLFAATCEYTAVTGTVPAGSAQRSGVGGAISSSAEMISSAIAPRDNVTCTREAVVEQGTRVILSWVESIVTAAERAEQCLLECLTLPPLEAIWCTGGCVAQLFTDIVTRTLLSITETVDIITGYIVTCELERGSGWIPTPAGKLDVGAIDRSDVPVTLNGGGLYLAKAVPGGDKPVDVDYWGNLAKSIFMTKMFECLLHGEWAIDRLEHLGLDRIDFLRDVPFGVRVCLDRSCTDTLLDAMGLGLLKDIGSLLSTLFASGFSAQKVIEALAKFLGPKGLDRLAQAIGISAPQLAGMLLALIIIIDYQALAVGGQIKLGDWLGYNKNGVCLHYPAFAIGALGYWNPFFAAALAVNFPIIVKER
jgi:hypothetical protein